MPGRLETLLYFYGPVSFLLLVNVALFSLTAIGMNNNNSRDDSSKSNETEDDAERAGERKKKALVLRTHSDSALYEMGSLGNRYTGIIMEF